LPSGANVNGPFTAFLMADPSQCREVPEADSKYGASRSKSQAAAASKVLRVFSGDQTTPWGS